MPYGRGKPKYFLALCSDQCEVQLKTLLGFCLKRMNGCFENRITAGDDISARQMGLDIGLYTNTDELATVCETVVFGTDASDTAAG